MPASRTSSAWDALTPRYRRRLEAAGITRESYLSGTKLQAARGQTRAERARPARERAVLAIRAQTVGVRYALPSPATVAAWKRRAQVSEMTDADWWQGVGDASSWAEIRGAVHYIEAAHAEWVRRGKPRSDSPKAVRAFINQEMPLEWRWYH